MLQLAAGAAVLPFWAAEGLMVIIGFGTGVLFPLSTVVVQNAVDRRDLGVATATHSFLRSLGTVVVVAVLGAIFLGSGLGEAIEGGRHGAGVDVDSALAGTTFRAMFAGSAIGQAIGLVILLFLEERPLAGRGGPKPANAD